MAEISIRTNIKLRPINHCMFTPETPCLSKWHNESVGTTPNVTPLSQMTAACIRSTPSAQTKIEWKLERDRTNFLPYNKQSVGTEPVKRQTLHSGWSKHIHFNQQPSRFPHGRKESWFQISPLSHLTLTNALICRSIPAKLKSIHFLPGFFSLCRNGSFLFARCLLKLSTEIRNLKWEAL